MWQPAPRQWRIIWPMAILVVLAWPPDSGRSLGAMLVNWAVDPGGSLPALPASLPMALDDDGDAVAEHDMQEAAWYQTRNSSALTRWRMDLKSAGDPLAPSTQRQVLVALLVVAGLTVWRLDAARKPEHS